MHFCEEKDIVYWQISCVLHGHGHHHHIVFWDISSIKPIHASGLNFWLHFCCIRISIRRSNHILLQLHHHHRNQHDQIILTMQVTSILGNTLVLWTVLFHKRMWSLTNYFLVSFDNMDENISFERCCWNNYDNWREWWMFFWWVLITWMRPFTRTTTRMMSQVNLAIADLGMATLNCIPRCLSKDKKYTT